MEGTADIVRYGDDVHIVLDADTRYTLKKSDDAEPVEMQIGNMTLIGVRIGRRILINITPDRLPILRRDGTCLVLPDSGYVATFKKKRFLGMIGERLRKPLTTRKKGVRFVYTKDMALPTRWRRNFIALNVDPNTPNGPICDLNGDPVLYRLEESYGLN